MAYTHTQHEVQFTTTAGGRTISATATGDKGEHMFGFVPHKIRAIAVMPLTSGSIYTSLQVSINHLDLASGSTASAIAVLNGSATDKPGHVIYKQGLDVTVNPGQKVVVNVSAAATDATADIAVSMFVEPLWQQPADDASMRATT